MIVYTLIPRQHHLRVGEIVGARVMKHQCRRVIGAVPIRGRGIVYAIDRRDGSGEKWNLEVENSCDGNQHGGQHAANHWRTPEGVKEAVNPGWGEFE